MASAASLPSLTNSTHNGPPQTRDTVQGRQDGAIRRPGYLRTVAGAWRATLRTGACRAGSQTRHTPEQDAQTQATEYTSPAGETCAQDATETPAEETRPRAQT
jgi:hypothetical protein